MLLRRVKECLDDIRKKGQFCGWVSQQIFSLWTPSLREAKAVIGDEVVVSHVGQEKGDICYFVDGTVTLFCMCLRSYDMVLFLSHSVMVSEWHCVGV